MSIISELLQNYTASGLVCISSWFALYYIILSVLRRNGKTKHFSEASLRYMSESYVAGIQGIICGTVGVIMILKCKYDVLKAQTILVPYYCLIGSAYFMYDLVAMFISSFSKLKDAKKHVTVMEYFKYYLKNNWLLIAHHLILVFVLSPAMLLYSNMGHFFVGCFQAMELSTPFVNARIILTQLGLKETNWYLCNGITMMIVFGIVRVLVFPFMYIYYIAQYSAILTIGYFQTFMRIPLCCHFFNSIVFMPQLYWLSLMVRGVKKALTQSGKYD